MQHIVKGKEPQSLTDWRQGEIDAQISPRYANLRNPQKDECRVRLLEEQGAVCCYCNRRIALGDMHIEHLIPQSVDDALDLAWGNLLGCCAPQNQKGKLRSQIHCGEFRGERALAITPLNPDCESHFVYSLRGEIGASAKSEAAAIQTIDHLNLTAERLRAARAQLLESAYLDLENLSEPDWFAVYIDRDIDGNFPDFAGMMRWFFETSWRAELLLLQSKA